jgi:hypothetical protein
MGAEGVIETHVQSELMRLDRQPAPRKTIYDTNSSSVDNKTIQLANYVSCDFHENQSLMDDSTREILRLRFKDAQYNLTLGLVIERERWIIVSWIISAKQQPNMTILYIH